MVESLLRKIGLADKEIAVYLASLRLGPAPIRRIGTEAGINRGTTYDILKSLRDQGLVSYYQKDKRQYFAAEDPIKLKEVLAARQAQLKETEAEIEAVLPQLESMYNRAGGKPVVKYYEGDVAISTILKDVLASCRVSEPKEYFVYSSSSIKDHLYKVYPTFSKDRIAAGVRVKVLSIGPGGETRGLDERRWLSKQESAPTYTILYAGKVGIISVGSDGKQLGIIIEDRNIFETQKMVFESVWSASSKL